MKLTKDEQEAMSRHLKHIDAAQDFFMELEAKYEGGGEPVYGAPIGQFGEAAETLSQIQMEFHQ